MQTQTPHPQKMTGRFAYRSGMTNSLLCPAMCRAFLLPGCNTAPYKRLQRVLPCQCNYTAHATKQHTGLYSGFFCNCAHSTAQDTRPTKAAIIPPVPRWSVHTLPDALSAYQIPQPRRDAVQVSTAVYYNNVYKGAGRPCYGSMPDGAAYRRPCQPGGSASAVCGSLASADTLSAVQTRRTR